MTIVHIVDYFPWTGSLGRSTLSAVVRDYETVLWHLADTLRELRGSMALSQEQLALAADVDRTYISQIERGAGNPSLAILCKLSQVLDVDIVRLLHAPPPSTGLKRNKRVRSSG